MDGKERISPHGLGYHSMVCTRASGGGDAERRYLRGFRRHFLRPFLNRSPKPDRRKSSAGGVYGKQHQPPTPLPLNSLRHIPKRLRGGNFVNNQNFNILKFLF